MTQINEIRSGAVYSAGRDDIIGCKVMSEIHPNLQLLMRFNPNDPEASAGLFAEDFVWHYFNPKLPDIEGDYDGFAGLKRFFRAMAKKSDASFKVNPVNAFPIGNELLVSHVQNSMTLEDGPLVINAVVVWRFVMKDRRGVGHPAVHEVARSSAGE